MMYPKMTQAKFLVLALLSATALLSGCGKQKPKELNDDAEYYLADSATSALNSALNDSEQSSSYAFSKPRFDFVSTAYATNSCDISRFTPAIGSADCSGTNLNKTVTSLFNTCTVGQSDEYILRGTVSLTFDSAATCNAWVQGVSLPATGSVTRSTTDFTRINPNGSQVSTSSADHQNYQNQNIGGGVVTSFGVGTRSVSIAGLHRVRTSALGFRVYDHSVSTPSPIVVTGTRVAGNRQVSSGSIRVDHNPAKYTSVANFSGLQWSAGCCHPTQGNINFALSGAVSGTLGVNFATGVCGEAEISRDGSVTKRVTLSSCE